MDNSALNPPRMRVHTIKTPQFTDSRQNLPYYIGLSKTTVGATGISMNLVVIPPGAKSDPHYHRDFETGIYVLEGCVQTRFGDELKYSEVNVAGDFVFIPPNLPHQAINLSESKEARAIVVRNDPNQQENVVTYNLTD